MSWQCDYRLDKGKPKEKRSSENLAQDVGVLAVKPEKVRANNVCNQYMVIKNFQWVANKVLERFLGR